MSSAPFLDLDPLLPIKAALSKANAQWLKMDKNVALQDNFKE